MAPRCWCKQLLPLGTYEKGEHIIDPHTGNPANAFLSFTVVGPDILQADVHGDEASFAMDSRSHLSRAGANWLRLRQ